LQEKLYNRNSESDNHEENNDDNNDNDDAVKGYVFKGQIASSQCQLSNNKYHTHPKTLPTRDKSTI